MMLKRGYDTSMNINLSRLLFCCSLISISTNVLAESFEEYLDNAIRTACHGHFFDGDLEFFKTYRFESPICKKVRTQGDKFNFPSERKKVKDRRYSQEELNQIFDTKAYQRRAPSKIEMECTYNIPGGPVGVDSKCLKVRENLADNNIKMSLQEYQRIEHACDNHHECIDNWAKRWRSGKRTFPPKTSVGSISLDDLMSTTKPAKQATSSALNANKQIKTRKVGDGDTTFDNIYSDREKIRNKTNQKLTTKQKNKSPRNKVAAVKQKPRQSNKQKGSSQKSGGLGAYIWDADWKRNKVVSCLVLNASGKALYTDFIRDIPMKGTWTISDDSVSVDVSGYDIAPWNNNLLRYKYTYILSNDKLIQGTFDRTNGTVTDAVDLSKVGKGLRACAEKLKINY